MHGQSYYVLEHCSQALMKLHKPETSDITHLLAMISEREDAVERLAGVRAAAVRALLPAPDREELPIVEFLKRFVREKEAENGVVVPFSRESQS
jgi:hypothetical protein